jgi:outer membrane protein
MRTFLFIHKFKVKSLPIIAIGLIFIRFYPTGNVFAEKKILKKPPTVTENRQKSSIPVSRKSTSPQVLNSVSNDKALITEKVSDLQPDSVAGSSTTESTPKTFPANSSQNSLLYQPITLLGSLTKTEHLEIDLSKILKLIETQNILIQQDKANARMLKYNYYSQAAEFLPNISGRYSQNRFQGAVQVFGGATVGIFRTTYQPQLNVSSTIYPGGKLVFDTWAAKRRKEAADKQVEDTLQQQLARASEDYYAILEGEIQRENALKSIEEVQQQVNLNDAKVKVGVGTKLDLLRSQTLLAKQQRALIDAENTIAISSQNLLSRLNIDMRYDISLPKLETVLPEAKKERVSLHSEVSELVAQAAKHNPTLERLTKELQALGIDLKSIVSEVVPSATVSAYINGTGPQTNALALTRYAGLTVDLNMFNSLGLDIPLRALSKKAEIQKKLLERQNMIRSVETRVVNAFINCRTYMNQVMTSEQEVKVAQEAYRLAVGRYQAGVGINLDVIDAELALSNARVIWGQALLNFNRSQIQLLEAMGVISSKTILEGLSSAD